MLALAIGAVAGCDGCRDEPAVPFAIDGPSSAAPGASPAPAPTGGVAPSASGGGTAARGAAPADPAKVVIAGRTVVAPEGHRFVQVLTGDADGDGVEDAFAWAEATEGGGELLFVAGRAGDPRSIHAEEPRAGCRLAAALERPGDETVHLALTVTCEAGARGREARRAVLIRLPSPGDGPPEVRLVVDQRPAPAGEALAVTVAVADRDGDGRDDVVLHATLDGAPPGFTGGARAEADVVYLDRPAGYALEPSEPERTLAAAATELLRRARRPADAEAAAAGAVPLVRLATALCGDLGAPLVTTTAGAIRCGELRAVPDAFAAMAWSALGRGDLPRALAAEAALRALGDRSEAQAEALRKALAKEVPVVDARVVTRADLDRDGAGAPLAPPFTWDAEGALLVQRGGGVVRLLPDGATEPSPAAAWPRAIRWSAGGEAAQLVSVVRRCGPSSLVAAVERGSARLDVPLPDPSVLVPRGLLGEACTAGRVDVGALSLGADRAVIAVGPVLAAIVTDGDGLRAQATVAPAASDPPAPPGGARAADGRTVVLLVGGDALVLGARARRWRAPEIASASVCAPQPGGERLACVGSRGVSVLEPRSGTPAAP